MLNSMFSVPPTGDTATSQLGSFGITEHVSITQSTLSLAPTDSPATGSGSVAWPRSILSSLRGLPNRTAK